MLCKAFRVPPACAPPPCACRTLLAHHRAHGRVLIKLLQNLKLRGGLSLSTTECCCQRRRPSDLILESSSSWKPGKLIANLGLSTLSHPAFSCKILHQLQHLLWLTAFRSLGVLSDMQLGQIALKQSIRPLSKKPDRRILPPASAGRRRLVRLEISSWFPAVERFTLGFCANRVKFAH